jgi:hypothetical protein
MKRRFFAMPKPEDCIEGQFYEFDRGQRPGYEIGKRIERKQAQVRLMRSYQSQEKGRGQPTDAYDVYTPLQSDAKSLAKDVRQGKAEWDGADEPGHFPHFHAGCIHRGHIFYGKQNYRLGESRR